jgi:hypothetical protein
MLLLLLMGELVMTGLHGATEGLAGALYVAAWDRIELTLGVRGWVTIVREEIVLGVNTTVSYIIKR